MATTTQRTIAHYIQPTRLKSAFKMLGKTAIMTAAAAALKSMRRAALRMSV